MAESSRAKSDPPRTNARNIPTLTDIVRPAEAAGRKPGRADPAESTAAAAVDDSHRKALERLIYKKLHQRLPKLAQELAADILTEIDGTGKKSKG